MLAIAVPARREPPLRATGDEASGHGDGHTAMASIAATSNGGWGERARRWSHGDGQHRRYVQRGIRRAVWHRKVGGTPRFGACQFAATTV